MSERILTQDEINKLVAAVHAKHGSEYRYHQTIEGVGPDGAAGRVDVFSNEADGWNERRTLHVLNSKILDPW